MAGVLDSILQIFIRADASQLKDGMSDAASEVESKAAKMAGAFETLASQSIKTKIATDAARSTLRAFATGELPICDSTTRQYSEALREAAEEAAKLRIAQAGVGEEAEKSVPKMAAASGAIRLMEGSTTGSIRAAERFITMLPGMSNLLQVAFPVVGAIALIGVLEHVATKLAAMRDSIVGYTSELKKHYQSLIEDNIRLFASFDNSKTGVQRLAEVNAQITLLDKQITALENHTDTAGLGIKSDTSLHDLQVGVEKQRILREEMLKNLVKVQGDEKKEADKAREQEAKDQERQDRDDQRKREQTLKLRERVTIQANAEMRRAEQETTTESMHLDEEGLRVFIKDEDEKLKKMKQSAERQRAALRESLEADVADAQRAFTIKSQQIDADYKLHLISFAQRIKLLRQAADEEVAIERAKIEAKIKVDQLDPDHPERVQHDLDELKKINQKYQSEIQKIENQTRDQSAAKWQSLFGTLKGGFASAMQSMVFSGRSLGDAMGSIFQGILGQGLSMLANLVTDWIEKHVFMAIFGKSTQTALGVSEVMSNAAVAASAAYASAAAIPEIGWAIAPGVAAEAYGTVSAMAPLASAARGWGKTSEGLMHIHENEMILPEDIAEPLRNGRGGGLELHLHDVIDAKSFTDRLEENSRVIAHSVLRELRGMGIA